MRIYNEQKEFKTKDQLLCECIREAFDDTNNDFMGDIEAERLIALCEHYKFYDLADEMRRDLETGKQFKPSYHE